MNIDELLTRRVNAILPSKEALEEVIQEKGSIRLYQGFDPTGGRLHLGHAIGLKKLMEFAKAGHEVIFLFGTGTVLVGDPSQRDSGRDLISQEEIEKNIKGWKDQTKKIVDFSKVTIKQNSDWLVPLTLKDIIQIASNISAIQLFKRDSFQKRLQKGNTVWYHETMYPLLQGYDSVAMDVDLEIGGTDQEFNMLIGRELQKKMNGHEKFVLTIPMILGTDGKQMSKTSGNCIWLNDTPEDMFGKVMSLIDEQIIPYFKLVTNTPLKRVGEIKQALASNELHPMEAKKELAHTIVTEFHSQKAADQAKEHFESTVQGSEVPENVQVASIKSIKVKLSIPPDKASFSISILDLCKEIINNKSNSQIKRVIKQGGVEIDGKKITNSNQEVKITGGEVLKFGKRTYIKME